MRVLKCGLLLSAVFLLGCANRATTPAAPVKLGLVTWIGYGPFYVAKDKGFFRDNKVDVDLQRIEGTVERRAAIASGQLDGIALTLDAMVVLRSRGIPVKTVMAIDSSNGGDGLVAIDAVGAVADLKGKQIAFPAGDPSHFFLFTVLKKNGLKMSDIKPVYMDADQAGAAFASGKIDAAVTWEPWLSRAKEVGRGHVLATSREFPGTIEDVLFVREDVIQKRPEAIAGIVKAWYRAVDFIASNPDESKAIMAKAFDLSSDKINLLLRGIRYEGKSGNEAAFGSATAPGFLFPLYDQITEAWLAEKVIQKADKPADGIDPQFVRQLH
jgi:NitT/TauT family transport system substrate-binding protein